MRRQLNFEKENTTAMRKVLVLLIAVTFVLALSAMAFDDMGKSATVKGWIADDKCGAKGDHAGMHGFGHEHGILCGGDASVHEYCVGAKFHCDCGIRCRSDSGIDNQGDACDHLAQDADVRLVLNSHAAADGGAQRHDGRRS